MSILSRRKNHRMRPPGHEHCENECPRCGVHGEVAGFLTQEDADRFDAWVDEGRVGELRSPIGLICRTCDVTWAGDVVIGDPED